MGLDVTQKLSPSQSAPTFKSALVATLGNSSASQTQLRTRPGPAHEPPAANLPTQSHKYLEARFQQGGKAASSERITYALSQKIFHGSDVPPEARELKKAVQECKKANILGTEKTAWSHTTSTAPKLARDQAPDDFKRKLLQIRSGLVDEKVQSQCKMHSDEEINERRRWLVGQTGRGNIGAYSNKWFNTVDERGLCQHCVQEDWPDWNHSHATHTKDDGKQAARRYQDREERRSRMDPMKKLNKAAYVNPQHGTANINSLLREKKIDYQELKDQFKRELKAEMPEASEERLQAIAQRLLGEKLMADEKACRFPANQESFRPNILVTTQDRRYKVFFHPGTWAMNEADKRNSWSCCANFTEDSTGCEYKVVNPDAWCVLGFERSPGMAAASKR